MDRTGQSNQYTHYKSKRTYKSKYAEFMSAEWRYSSNEININEETVVPSMPTTPQQEPNDALYHNQQLECDEKVDALYKELNDFTLEYKTKQREMYDEQNGKGAVWKELKEHFDEQKVHITQKRAVMALREKADKEIQELVREISKLMRQCHPTYN